MLSIVTGKVECSSVGRNAIHKLMDSKEHVTKDTSPNMKLLWHTTVKLSKPSKNWLTLKIRNMMSHVKMS